MQQKYLIYKELLSDWIVFSVIPIPQIAYSKILLRLNIHLWLAL